MNTMTRLEASVAQTRPIVAAIDDDQLTAPTPCGDWDTAALLNHVLEAFVMFRDIGTNGSPDPATFGADHRGDDRPLDAFDRLANEAMDAWRAEGRLGGTAQMPWGEMPADMAVQMLADDVLVHGW